VYLTGGEPMMEIMTVKALTAFFTEMKVNVFIYSSACTIRDMSNWSSLICDYKLSGITFTIHEPQHIHEFQRLDRLIAIETQYRKKPLSLRLNKFDHFDMDYVPVCNWDKKEIHWLKNCPLPVGEDFRTL
jgi:organic radical activating enzyme